jgi:hypothetical protein
MVHLPSLRRRPEPLYFLFSRKSEGRTFDTLEIHLVYRFDSTPCRVVAYLVSCSLGGCKKLVEETRKFDRTGVLHCSMESTSVYSSSYQVHLQAVKEKFSILQGL